MFFNKVCITSAGYDILGPALAGSSTSGSTPLTAIWGNAYTSNVDTSMWSNHDMNQASVNTSSKFNPASTYTCSGVVVSAVCSKQIIDSDDNAIEASVITLSLNMTNSTYNGTAATLLVFGMANIGDTPQLLIIASSNNPDIVPSGQPYNAIVDLHIQMSDTATTSITATDGWYASAENLQKLNNRAVTKHSLNDPSIGDDQTILGIKTFSNNTRHSGNILTTANGSLDIGTSASRWRTVYATTFDGNSSTATKLSTARKIDGVNFDGSADIYHYCTCGTGSSAVTKQISLGTVNQLSHGLTVTVRFKYGNTADSPKLQINTLSAADIYQRRVDSGSQSSDEELAGNNPALSWAPGETITFVYDGNSSNGGSGKWYIVGHQNKPYLLAATGAAASQVYPLVFRDYSNETSLSDGYSILYTDGENAINYTPYCSTLSCKTLYGRATSTNIQSDAGILSNGSTCKFYNGTCTTVANTATKAVTCSGFEYQTGAVITVNFTYKNSVTSQVYLNVNNKGAKPVNQESTVPGDDINSAVSNWAAGAVITFKYDGTSWIPIDVIHKHRYGTCTTADDKPNKVATIEDNSFVLTKGAEVFIKFDYYNSSTSEVTLNVNGTGAKPIKRNTGIAVSSTKGTSWENNETVHFIYDGSNWVIMNKMCAELVGVSTKGSNEDCPLVFISGIGSSKKLSRHIYTDTANSIYYNPSTNILTCPKFSGDLSGKIPESVTSIGCIFLAYIKGNSSTHTQAYKAGDIITSSDSSAGLSVCECISSSISTSSSTGISPKFYQSLLRLTGKFRLLSGFDGVSNSSAAIALVMKIE